MQIDKLLINEQIKAKEINLVDNHDKFLGSYPTKEAISIAKEQSLDLIQIIPSNDRPFCQISKLEYSAAKAARSYLNYLLTLNIRGEEAFGPLALSFIRENDFDKLQLLPEEQFNLIMATIQVLAAEPKRFSVKVDLLKKAQSLLSRTRYHSLDLSRQIQYDITKTEAELKIYNEAMKPSSQPTNSEKHQLIVQSDIPEYILNTAQKRAAEYYKEKFKVSKKGKLAQHFSGGSRKFEPDNSDVHKEFPGACAPFMNVRTNAFHIMLPFDIKISRRPEEQLDAGARIYYSKMGYSLPLGYEKDKLVNFNNGEVVDINMDDPNLLFFSVSRVKEPEFKYQGSDPGIPPQYAYPYAVLQRTNCLGPYLQVVTNFKVWFDSSTVSLLVQGAPDLYEYGLQGGSGLMTRSHGSDKVEAYAENTRELWQEGLSFNFVNLHLILSPGNESAFVPYNTPIFTIYPTLNNQNYKIEDYRKASR